MLLLPAVARNVNGNTRSEIKNNCFVLSSTVQQAYNRNLLRRKLLQWKTRVHFGQNPPAVEPQQTPGSNRTLVTWGGFSPKPPSLAIQRGHILEVVKVLCFIFFMILFLLLLLWYFASNHKWGLCHFFGRFWGRDFWSSHCITEGTE